MTEGKEMMLRSFEREENGSSWMGKTMESWSCLVWRRMRQTASASDQQKQKLHPSRILGRSTPRRFVGQPTTWSSTMVQNAGKEWNGLLQLGFIQGSLYSKLKKDVLLLLAMQLHR
jgi:hypothetical protein